LIDSRQRLVIFSFDMVAVRRYLPAAAHGSEAAYKGVWEGALVVEGSSVLIVERSGEIREVLRTALARRGLQIYEASRAGEGLELARRRHPDLVVLDLDDQSASADDLTAEFSRASQAAGAPLIVLGTLRHLRADCGQFIAKPYHYQPLISKIEQLLRARP
jgi:DNA-binding response OmpR family regulator